MPVVKTPPFNAGGMDSILGWGIKIPHATTQCGKKKKQNKTADWTLQPSAYIQMLPKNKENKTVDLFVNRSPTIPPCM